MEPPPKLVLRVVSGPVIYTAISVINALQRSGRRFLPMSPSWTPPDRKYQVHTGKCHIYLVILVFLMLKKSKGSFYLCISSSIKAQSSMFSGFAVLQFVPGHIDVRSCSFSEAIERGLSRAFAEVRRRSQESTNFTVHVSHRVGGGEHGQPCISNPARCFYLLGLWTLNIKYTEINATDFPSLRFIFIIIY